MNTLHNLKKKTSTTSNTTTKYKKAMRLHCHVVMVIKQYAHALHCLSLMRTRKKAYNLLTKYNQCFMPRYQRFFTFVHNAHIVFVRACV